jgi:hypothetical protein
MAFPEGSVLWENVAYNNNIAWKNLTVVSGEGGGRVIVRNTAERDVLLALRFAVPVLEVDDHLLRHADVVVDLGREIMRKWRSTKRRPRGFEVVGSSSTIRITDPSTAAVAGLPFGPGEEHVISVRIQVRGRADQRLASKAGKVLNLDILQVMQTSPTGRVTLVGGERYAVKA